MLKIIFSLAVFIAVGAFCGAVLAAVECDDDMYMKEKDDDG